jgi:hypothetical protein
LYNRQHQASKPGATCCSNLRSLTVSEMPWHGWPEYLQLVAQLTLQAKDASLSSDSLHPRSKPILQVQSHEMSLKFFSKAEANEGIRTTMLKCKSNHKQPSADQCTSMLMSWNVSETTPCLRWKRWVSRLYISLCISFECSCRDLF